jgi:hypothetical protein
MNIKKTRDLRLHDHDIANLLEINAEAFIYIVSSGEKEAG